MKKLTLHWKIIIGLILGIIWALLSSKLGWSQFTINWIAPFGTIFINLLKLIAVPLVLVSIISGVANIGDPSSLGRMGGKTLIAYLITTLFAVGLGLTLVNIIGPGKLIDKQSRIDNRISYELWASSEGHEIKDGIHYLQKPEYLERAKQISDLSRNELKNATVEAKKQTAKKTKTTTPLQPLVDIVPENFFFSLSNNGLMLQIIFFGIFFGICLLLIPNEKSHPVTTFMDSTMEVFLKW